MRDAVREQPRAGEGFDSVATIRGHRFRCSTLALEGSKDLSLLALGCNRSADRCMNCWREEDREIRPWKTKRRPSFRRSAFEKGLVRVYFLGFCVALDGARDATPPPLLVSAERASGSRASRPSVADAATTVPSRRTRTAGT